MGECHLISCKCPPGRLGFCVHRSWDHILEVRTIMRNKIGLESSNLKSFSLNSIRGGKKNTCDFPNWNGKRKKKKKEKMFKVAGPLLVQILKTWLNTQSHKTLNEEKKGKSHFIVFPQESTKRQMVQMRGSLVRWVLNNLPLLWQRKVCSELCDDFVLPRESPTVRKDV